MWVYDIVVYANNVIIWWLEWCKLLHNFYLCEWYYYHCFMVSKWYFISYLFIIGLQSVRVVFLHVLELKKNCTENNNLVLIEICKIKILKHKSVAQNAIYFSYLTVKNSDQEPWIY